VGSDSKGSEQGFSSAGKKEQAVTTTYTYGNAHGFEHNAFCGSEPWDCMKYEIRGVPVYLRWEGGELQILKRKTEKRYKWLEDRMTVEECRAAEKFFDKHYEPYSSEY
jgi:hypothetical protein